MKLPFYSRQFVSKLRDNAESNISKYGQGSSWLDDFAVGMVRQHESDQIVDPPPQLLITATDNASNDAENAKRVYAWLNKLRPDIAMEERLWACLTHSVFADYMAARWPTSAAGIIQRRYLLESRTFAALTRNGISRLWWAGYLTHEPDRANAFELTEILFLRQDIQVSLLERSLGKSKSVRTAVLEFIRDNQGWLADESFGPRIQALLKEVNLLGGVAILDALPASEVKQHLTKVSKRLGAP